MTTSTESNVQSLGKVLREFISNLLTQMQVAFLPYTAVFRLMGKR
jgi:hypothetical protein